MICALVGGFVGMSVIEVMVSYHDANTAAAGAAVGLVAALADTAFHLAGNVFGETQRAQLTCCTLVLLAPPNF